MIFEFIAFFVLLFIIIGLVYQFMYSSFTWVLIASVIFYALYIAIKIMFHFIKNKTPSQKATIIQPTQQVQPQQFIQPAFVDKDVQLLKEFITKNVKEGFKTNVIKTALLKQGWPEDKVNQAILESSR